MVEPRFPAQVEEALGKILMTMVGLKERLQPLGEQFIVEVSTCYPMKHCGQPHLTRACQPHQVESRFPIRSNGSHSAAAYAVGSRRYVGLSRLLWQSSLSSRQL